MKVLQCSPGNKACGKRCVPQAHKCRGEKREGRKETKASAQSSDKALMEDDVKKGGLHWGVKAALVTAGVSLAVFGGLTIVGIAKSQGAPLAGGATLDQLKPGDVVRKPTIVDGARVAHYAVYLGPSENDPDMLTFLEVNGSQDWVIPGKEQSVKTVNLQKREVDPETLSVWEKVDPPKGVFKQFGENGAEYLNLFDDMNQVVAKYRDEAAERGDPKALEASYTVLGVSCESFANAIAYGVPFSEQADKANVLARKAMQSAFPNDKGSGDPYENRDRFFSEVGLTTPKPGFFGLNDKMIADAQSALESRPDITEKRAVIQGLAKAGLSEQLGLREMNTGMKRIGMSIAGTASLSQEKGLLQYLFGTETPPKYDQAIPIEDMQSLPFHKKSLAKLYNQAQKREFFYLG